LLGRAAVLVRLSARRRDLGLLEHHAYLGFGELGPPDRDGSDSPPLGAVLERKPAFLQHDWEGERLPRRIQLRMRRLHVPRFPVPPLSVAKFAVGHAWRITPAVVSAISGAKAPAVICPALICRASQSIDDTSHAPGRMIDDMGIFRTTVEIASVTQQDNRLRIDSVMVDTGSEYNWFPEELLASLGIVPVRVDRFETADGRVIERPIGWGVIPAGDRSTVAVLVFAKPGEMSLLGAHGLGGMNLRVDLVRRELIPAGPVPAARASRRPLLASAYLAQSASRQPRRVPRGSREIIPQP